MLQGETSYLFIIVITRSNMHIWLLIILFSVSISKVQSQQKLSYHMSLAIPIKHLIIHSENKKKKMLSIQKKLIQQKKIKEKKKKRRS